MSNMLAGQGFGASYYQGLYAVPDAQTSGGVTGAASTVGASFGFNVGSETFRVQASIAGLFLAAVIGLLWLHRNGHRASVRV